jgi:UDP-glucose 4-epimerase
MKYLVTGGAGFIGSHVVDQLIKDGHEVICYDNFSTGKKIFIQHHLKNDCFALVKADLLETKKLQKAMKGVDFVFHIAGYADVRSGLVDHQINHIQNLEVTHAVLEAMHVHGVTKIAFASTSSVYGDAEIHPTPENTPFHPTSLYGSAKASSEQYIEAYAAYYDWNAYIFRFVSFVGERYTHGIIYDILRKIKQDPETLELLSDGTPRKSSVYVGDGVKAIFTAIKKAKGRVNIFNIGHDEIMTVDEIVDTVLKAADISIKKKYLGGKRGWKGDNNFVHLDNAKLKALGWKPTKTLREGIEKTVDYLLSNPKFFI